MLYAKYRTQYNALFQPPLDPSLDINAADAARFPVNGAPGAAGSMLDTTWKAMVQTDRDIINTIMANVGKAIEAYERKLVSRNAPIDKYIEGDRTALTPAQKRGLRLFIGKAACVDCHSGPVFTDNKFHNTGVPQAGINAPVTDNGRFDEIPKTLSNDFNTASKYSDDQTLGKAKMMTLAQTEDLKGAFRTSMLRQIEMTGPYMHTGSLETLDAVVRFYNWGGGSTGFAGTKHPAMVPLLLSDDEIADLVAFLHSLTGDPPPADLGKNTAIPDTLPDMLLVK
jgi:cytochrome c peroxidase